MRCLTDHGLAGKPILPFDHHLCHAATAYYHRPWSGPATVLTLDGAGDGICASVNLGLGSPREDDINVIARTPMTAGRYELETEIIVRAARLGFQLAEVTVPTVYGDEQSQFRLVRDVPRIVGTLLRLTAEGIVPPSVMRRAAGSGGTAAS